MVDPSRVPQRTLYTGAKMPAIGLGTFGSDHVSPAAIAEAVQGAIEVGYRHLDCASVYGNEDRIGAALARGRAVPRDQLWITSKLWNDKHIEAMSSRRAGSRLPTCSSITWTCTSCTGRFRISIRRGARWNRAVPMRKPYIHDNFMRTWRQMEKLVDLGLTRHIGTSNMTIPKLRLLLRDARIKPAVNEMELHPHFQQPELFEFVRANGIEPIGYSPIGSPEPSGAGPHAGRYGRYRGSGDRRDRAAARGPPGGRLHQVGGAARADADPAIGEPRAIIVANLEASSSEPLTDEDMRAIAGIDRNCRLIKGQVFLWKDRSELGRSLGREWSDTPQ